MGLDQSADDGARLRLSLADLKSCSTGAAKQGRGALHRRQQPNVDANSDSAIARLLPALARRLRRLKQLETRFDEALEAEKLEAMAEFAAGAGHEINNPLAVISGRAQLFCARKRTPSGGASWR